MKRYNSKYIIRGKNDADLRDYEIMRLANNLQKSIKKNKLAIVVEVSIIIAVLIALLMILQQGG